jgi:monovalent cation:H+ antiporter-2, CPA2 family
VEVSGALLFQLGASIPVVAALATSYVFIMAIAGPVLARYTGSPRPAGVETN